MNDPIASAPESLDERIAAISDHDLELMTGESRTDAGADSAPHHGFDNGFDNAFDNSFDNS